MEIDKTTLSDLSIFNIEENYSVFNTLNFTLTSNGKEQFRKTLSTPLKTLDSISGIQQTLKTILKHTTNWPREITNGTIMVVERFYESQIDPIPKNPTTFSAYGYKLMHAPDFSLVKYSLTHCFDFIKGMQKMEGIFADADEIPPPLQKQLTEISRYLKQDKLQVIKDHKQANDLTIVQLLDLAHFFRYKYKIAMLELVTIHAQLDAWYGMAMAVTRLDLVFPEITDSPQPYIKIENLYHILLAKPVSYNVNLDRDTNFVFLTGANMAGKSTFIKSVGTAVFLAHLGMGVPAKEMKLSMFDGMLSNINVIDNIAKGESYFYNEVQRIKATITKVNDGRKWLILIDELFKGTNVQDAMKCSTAVIEGLIKMRNALFILSTHLYEIGDALKVYPNISFNYFETEVTDGQLRFNYQLRNGISNDRLGYLILKNEGVVKMLEGLK